MTLGPTMQDDASNLSASSRTGRSHRTLFDVIRLSMLLIVSVAIGCWDSLAACLLFYLAGLGVLIRQMLPVLDHPANHSTKSNNPDDLIWIGRKARAF